MENIDNARGAGGPPDLPPPLPSKANAGTAVPPSRAQQSLAAHMAAPLLDFDGESIAATRRPAQRAVAQEDDENQDGDGAEISPLVQSFVLWGTVSLVFGVFVVWVNNAPMVLRSGFLLKVFAILVGTGLGATGAVIGDALRKFTLPDAMFTTGGMGRILWLKLFWRVGPQIIGMGIGTILGISVVLS